MRNVVCTVLEGDYHLGLGALINSLIAANYKGVFIAGIRDSIPGWADREATSAEGWELAPGVRLRFVSVESEIHLSNEKARFMLRVIELAPDLEAIWYFDPDITVKAPWEFYERWVGQGVALCGDASMVVMPPTHPKRADWMRLGARLGLTVHHSIHSYLNSGFVGMTTDNFGFLELWNRIIQLLPEEGVDLRRFLYLPHWTPWWTGDQDALNLAAMTTSCPLSLVGPDGMDFTPGGYIMSHCGVKPWRGRFVRLALSGVAPNAATRQWAKHITGTVSLYSPLNVAWIRARIRLAAFIARFIRKSS